MHIPIGRNLAKYVPPCFSQVDALQRSAYRLLWNLWCSKPVSVFTGPFNDSSLWTVTNHGIMELCIYSQKWTQRSPLIHAQKAKWSYWYRNGKVGTIIRLPLLIRKLICLTTSCFIVNKKNISIFNSLIIFKTHQPWIMPDIITVTEFVKETNEDYKAPTTSNFTTRMSHCRNAVAALEEVS